MSATLSGWGAELARGDGPGRIYVVEPTGPYVDDPDLTDKRFPGNPTRSYRSRQPLRVVAEVMDWQGHTPEEVQAMVDARDRRLASQAALVARIPEPAGMDPSEAQARQLALEWAPDAQRVGRILLMAIQGASVEIFSATTFRSQACGETRTFELPRPLPATPGWQASQAPLSGRLSDVTAWREGWACVLDACVTEIGLSQQARLWVAVDAEDDRLTFRVDAVGAERSWQRNLQLARGVLTDADYGAIWDFVRDAPA